MKNSHHRLVSDHQRFRGFTVWEIIIALAIIAILGSAVWKFFDRLPPEMKLKMAAANIVENAGNWRNHTENLGKFKAAAVEMDIDGRPFVKRFEESAHRMTEFGVTMVEKLEESERERTEQLWASFLARLEAQSIKIGATSEFRKEVEEYEAHLQASIPKLTEERAKVFGNRFRELTDAYGELLSYLKTIDK
ncbi:MAG: prepilin-type N-terminal cleavage/methylation domain-containing protein [Verrucomicrobiota bacterium]